MDEGLEDEQLDGFSNVVTNASAGVAIGGSCTGGLIFFIVLIYFLYRLLKPKPRIEPTIVYVRPAAAVPNQNRAPCSRCGNVPSSPPLSARSELEFPMEECICCMSAPPSYSQQQLS